MKDYFLRYGIMLGRRFTKRQKAIFLEAAAKEFESVGFTAQIYQNNSKFTKMTNIVFGNLQTAETIFIAGYDTGSRVFVPNYVYYPFNPAKNLNNEKLNLFLSSLLSSLFFAAAVLLLSNLAKFMLALKILMAILSVLLISCALFLLSGLSNSVNYGRNSASVILLLSLAKDFAKTENAENKDKAAFIFTDNCIASYDGYRLINHMFRDFGVDPQAKTFVVFDALAAGTTLVMARKRETAFQAQNIKNLADGLDIYDKVYDNDKSDGDILGILPNTLYFACGDIENKEFAVHNTRSGKDYRADFDRLEKLKIMFLTYLQNVQ